MRKVAFHTLCEPFIRSRETFCRPSTVEVHRAAMGRLVDYFGSRDVNSLTTEDLRDFLQWRLKQGVSSNTANKDARSLRALLGWAEETGRIPALPFRFRFLKAPRRRVVPLLSKEDLRRLIECADGRYRVLILLAATTGLRLTEILMLTWGNVYLAENRIAIQDNKEWGWTTKSGENRTLFIPEEVSDALRKWKDKSPFKEDSDFVLSTRTRRPLMRQNVAAKLRDIFTEAGLYQKGRPLTHWLRHNACSSLLGAGVDVETVRTIMGHADCRTTLNYAHSSSERLRAASKLLGL